MLVVLCGTEIVSWGVLYYAFPVLAPAISRDTGWSTPMITAAFSTGLIVSGIAGIPVGRWLDQSGPRPVMTVGAVVAVPALAGIALAPTLPWFFAAWALAGLAMSGTLYPPAFAALTRWWGTRRLTALTAVTLLAGLASTVFAPITAALLAATDWRTTYLVLAVVLGAIVVPAHALGLRGPWPSADHAVAPPHQDDAAIVEPSAIVRGRPFALLTAASALAALATSAVVVNQVPLLLERGLSTTAAAWALGLGGAGQVLGRLGYARLAAATTVRARTVGVLAVSAVATALLGLLPGPAVLLVAAAVLAGAARGLVTLLQATAITDRWGAAHYGRLSGIVAAPALAASAVAPWAGAALAGPLGGYPAVFLLLAAAAVAAAVLMTWTIPVASARAGGPPRR